MLTRERIRADDLVKTTELVVEIIKRAADMKA